MEPNFDLKTYLAEAEIDHETNVARTEEGDFVFPHFDEIQTGWPIGLVNLGPALLRAGHTVDPRIPRDALLHPFNVAEWLTMNSYKRAEVAKMHADDIRLEVSRYYVNAMEVY